MFLIFAALTPMPILSTSLWFSTNQWLSLSRLLKSHMPPPHIQLMPNLGSGTSSLKAAASTSQMSLAGKGGQTTSPNGTPYLFSSETTGSGGELTVRGCAMASTQPQVLTPTNTPTSTLTPVPMKVD